MLNNSQNFDWINADGLLIVSYRTIISQILLYFRYTEVIAWKRKQILTNEMDSLRVSCYFPKGFNVVLSIFRKWVFSLKVIKRDATKYHGQRYKLLLSTFNCKIWTGNDVRGDLDHTKGPVYKGQKSNFYEKIAFLAKMKDFLNIF